VAAGDTGAGYAEYVGLGVLVAVVIGALVVSGLPRVFGSGARDVVCRIVQPGRGCRRTSASPVTTHSPAAVGPVVSSSATRSAVPVAPSPGVNRAADGLVDNLYGTYNSDDGQWNYPGVGWWQGANVLTAALEHDICAGDNKYAGDMAEHTLDLRGNSFTNDYNDDTGWWGLAYIRAYDLTGDTQFLDVAKRNADKMWNTGHDSRFGGGLYWRDAHDSKNAITNELYIELAAQLHNRIPGDTGYQRKAQDTWQWFKNSGMINKDNLVNDGLDDQGHNNHETTWTYNQGVILGGLVALYKATGDAGLLDQARKIADATVNSPTLSPNGILTEPCASGQNCGQGDGKTFKGAFIRNLATLNQALPDHPYQSYMNHQAASILQNDTNDHGGYGFNWRGPYDGGRAPDPALQATALDALNAAGCQHPGK
jgi:predicted alpha-1,6-mannanase (GH76 family)